MVSGAPSLPDQSLKRMAESQRVRLMCVPRECNALMQEAVEPARIVSFPHPKTAQPTQFLLTSKAEVCELQSFMPSGTKYGSFFVGQRTVSDGHVYVASMVDPKFLLLPILQQHKARFSPLEQILAGESGGLLMQLRKSPRLDLHKICDVNDQLGDDMLLYRLDEGKVLAWLSEKVKRVQRVVKVLEARRVQGGLGTAFVQGFRPTEQPAPSVNPEELPDTPAHTNIAIELVCEYLSSDWSDKVAEALQKKEESAVEPTASVKRSAWEQSDVDKAMELIQGKKSKVAGDTPAASAAPKQTVAQKKLEKVDKKGMRSLTSFFGKK